MVVVVVEREVQEMDRRVTRRISSKKIYTCVVHMKIIYMLYIFIIYVLNKYVKCVTSRYMSVQ